MHQLHAKLSDQDVGSILTNMETDVCQELDSLMKVLPIDTQVHYFNPKHTLARKRFQLIAVLLVEKIERAIAEQEVGVTSSSEIMKAPLDHSPQMLPEAP